MLSSFPYLWTSASRAFASLRWGVEVSLWDSRFGCHMLSWSYRGLVPSQNDCSLFKVDECFQSFHVSQVGRGGKPVGIQVRLPRSILILLRTSSLSIYLVSLSKWTSASKAFKSLRWGMEVSLGKPGSAATPYFILSRTSSLSFDNQLICIL